MVCGHGSPGTGNGAGHLGCQGFFFNLIKEGGFVPVVKADWEVDPELWSVSSVVMCL